MTRPREKVLVAGVLSLVLGFLIWTVALADNPADPLPSVRPQRGRSYSYSVGGTQWTVFSANETHVYYDVAEATYSLHNTRLQSCALCHALSSTNPPSEITGMNAYGSALIDELAKTVPGVAYGNDRVDVITHTVIVSALVAIENLDSDYDGGSGYDPSNESYRASNKHELSSLTFPGGIATTSGIISDTWEQVASTDSLGGVHGGYGDTPDQCARCHRAHTAQDSSLVTQRQADLCLSCHNGAGADTDVQDGALISDGSGLRGGGFVNASMDTDVSGQVSSSTTTSSHIVDATPATMWGWIGAGSSYSATGKLGATLECGDCHNPHMPTWSPDGGSTRYTQYRMIQGRPREAGYGDDNQSRYFYLSVPDESPRSYVQTYASTSPGSASRRPATDYQVSDRIGEFCALCHTRYMAHTIVADNGDPYRDTVGSRPRSGDSIFTYQHATKEATCSTGGCHSGHSFSRPRCLDCHVAHGTSATMGSYSNQIAFPNGTLTTTVNARSSLLRLNNRGVCEGCHGK